MSHPERFQKHPPGANACKYANMAFDTRRRHPNPEMDLYEGERGGHTRIKMPPSRRKAGEGGQCTLALFTPLPAPERPAPTPSWWRPAARGGTWRKGACDPCAVEVPRKCTPASQRISTRTKSPRTADLRRAGRQEPRGKPPSRIPQKGMARRRLPPKRKQLRRVLPPGHVEFLETPWPGAPRAPRSGRPQAKASQGPPASPKAVPQPPGEPNSKGRSRGTA